MKMKDKNAVQKEKRAKAKANRRTSPLLGRSEPTKIEKPTFLIVCEGKNTEPSYFKRFKLSTATVIPIGEGYNTLSLIKRAIHLSKEKEYEQVWCVFDKDDFDNTDFNNAITLAQAQKFHVAYSNQAFEYWVILHFNDHQGGGIHRDQYDKMLNEYLKPLGAAFNGKTDKTITESIFQILEAKDPKTGVLRKVQAISRAKRNYGKLGKISSPAKQESSTTVFKLVEELEKYR